MGRLTKKTTPIAINVTKTNYRFSTSIIILNSQPNNRPNHLQILQPAQPISIVMEDINNGKIICLDNSKSRNVITKDRSSGSLLSRLIVFED